MFRLFEGKGFFDRNPRWELIMQVQDTSIGISSGHLFASASKGRVNFRYICDRLDFAYETNYDGFAHYVLLRHSSERKVYHRTCTSQYCAYTGSSVNRDVIWSLDICPDDDDCKLLIEVTSKTKDVYRSIELGPFCVTTKYPARKSTSVDYFESLFIFHRQLTKMAIPRVDSKLVST